MAKKIYIIGDIDEEACEKFSRRLNYFEANNTYGNTVIEVELMSDGGSAMCALAFYDKIINSPLTINITATGAVQSAAVLILAAGDTRRMTSSAWLMVHEDSFDADGENLTVSQIEAYAKNFRRMETQWCRLLASETSTSFDKWTELHKNTTYLTPEECFDLGIIEEIV